LNKFCILRFCCYCCRTVSEKTGEWW